MVPFAYRRYMALNNLCRRDVLWTKELSQIQRCLLSLSNHFDALEWKGHFDKLEYAKVTCPENNFCVPYACVIFSVTSHGLSVEEARSA